MPGLSFLLYDLLVVTFFWSLATFIYVFLKETWSFVQKGGRNREGDFELDIEKIS